MEIVFVTNLREARRKVFIHTSSNFAIKTNTILQFCEHLLILHSNRQVIIFKLMPSAECQFTFQQLIEKQIPCAELKSPLEN